MSLCTTEAIRARRSVRAFLSAPLPPQELRELFELAQCAPSNCNTQPWIVHVASGAVLDTLRRRLGEAAHDPLRHSPDFAFDFRYEQTYRQRQYAAAAALYGALGVQRNDMAARLRAMLRNHEAFGAPHAAFVFLPEPFGIREAVDCGMWGQTLMLALAGRGLGSCPQAALSFHPDIVREMLDVPATHRLLYGIAFGRPDAAAPANACHTGRAPLSENVSFHG